MTTAAHLGIVNRFVNRLLGTRTIDDVSKLIHGAILEFGLTGHYCVRSGVDFVCHSVGCDLPNDLIDQLCTADFGSSRIARLDESMHIRYKYFVISVNTTGVSSDLEVLQDTLAIFSETASRGIQLINSIDSIKADEIARRTNILKKLKQSRCELGKLKESLVQGEIDLAEFLLLNIMAMFPVIGLETDQEDRVLAILTKASELQREQSLGYRLVVDEINESMIATIDHLKKKVD